MAEHFRFHLAWLKQAERLSESERGRLLAGIAEYSQTGIVPEFRGNERYLFPLLSPAPDAPAAKPPRKSTVSDFEQFWTIYPKKVGKKAAETAFGAMMNRPKPPTLEQLIASVEAHKGLWSWKKEGGQYIPMPTTYLTQDRWKDDLTNEPKEQPSVAQKRYGVQYEQNTLTDEQLKRIEVDLDKDIE